MLKWATVSLRKELIDEIRTILRTGRYRSISEFIAEAVRLRLEEIANSQGELTVREFLDTTVTPEIAQARGYINTMLDHLEQIWWVLVRLFEDLIKKNVQLNNEVACDLQNCRILINFIRTHICPDCDIEATNKTLPDLQRTLEKVKHSLMAVAFSVGEDYAEKWMETINKADRGELHCAIPILTTPKFVPGLPTDHEKGWIRVTLSKPVTKQKIEDISRKLGVIAEFENDLQIIVKGEKRQVKKAVEMIYRAA